MQIDDLRLPAEFRRTTVDVHGEAGREWLNNLPDRLQTVCNRWNLKIEAPFERLSYNFVAAAIRADGSKVVLKAGVPCHELTSEMDALRYYDGCGAVKLLEADESAGVMLLERVLPGHTLLELLKGGHAMWVIPAVAEVMRKIRRPPPPEHRFKSVADWAKGFERLRQKFDGGTGPFPTATVEMAEGIYKDLLSDPGEQVLLHGDLHHENILESVERGYLVIDPKGIVGEPAYEVGAFLRNPMPWVVETPSFNYFHARRMYQLVEELELDPKRVRDWTVAQAVLSAWWTYEDHGAGWEPMIRFAQLFSRIYAR